MQYPNIHEAIFLKRPNRFLAQVELDGKAETVHVKNTGRCKELLVPGTTVYLVKSDNPKRKTQFDLVGVEKEKLLINMDLRPSRKNGHEMRRKSGMKRCQSGVRFRRRKHAV